MQSPIESAVALLVVAAALRQTMQTGKNSSFYALYSASSSQTEGSALTRFVSEANWVVTVLALSLCFNGYLLRGVMAALTVNAAPRLEDTPTVSDAQESTPDTSQEREPEQQPLILSPAPIPLSKLTLESLDESFKARGWLPPTPLSNPSASSIKDFSTDEPISVHPLSECLEIFEKGPRPESLALSLLNDEESILLVQNGKIAAYALEKVLDGGNRDNIALERAVRIRRALICMYFFPLLIIRCNWD